MSAHVEVIGYGRSASTICEACGIVRVHPRTAPAQADARAHNQEAHAFPPELDLEPEPNDQENA